MARDDRHRGTGLGEVAAGAAIGEAVGGVPDAALD